MAIIALSIYLVFFELNMGFNETIRSELVFADLKMQDIQVTLSLDLIKVPCEVADVRFVSRKGREHTIKRYHLPKSGVPAEMTGERPIEEIEKGIRSGEGCRISGTFFKHFVMNNFYIGFGNPQLLSVLLMRNPEFSFDLSHIIHTLLLGDTSKHDYYSQKYKIGGFNKLEKFENIEPNRPRGERTTYKHTYFIQAIPTVFDGYFGSSAEIFQYTTSKYSKESPEDAIIFL